jgi:uncharacterized protein (DUF486 family)
MLFELIDLLVIIAVLGLVLALFNMLPIFAPYKDIVNKIAIVVLVVVLIVWMLAFLGYDLQERFGRRAA